VPAGVKTALALLALAGAVVLCYFAYEGLRAKAPQPEPPDLEDYARKARYGTDPRARCEAIQKVGRDASPDAVPVLLETLQDPNEYVAAASARFLGKRRVTEAVEPLTRQLERDSRDLRRATIYALGDIGHPSAAKALAGQITARNPFAADAAWAMGKLRDPKTGGIPDDAEQALIELLDSSVLRIRIGAIHGLRLGARSQAAVDALDDLKRDPKRGLDEAIFTDPRTGKPRMILEKFPASPTHITIFCQWAIDAIRARMGEKEG